MNDETREAQEPALDAATVIQIARHYCDAKRKHPHFAETLANRELAEAWEGLARGDKAAAVGACFDVIAVLLRMIDVLEGRQNLGRPECER